MKINDKIYSDKHIGTIEEFNEDKGMFGIVFNSRDGTESNFNYVAPSIIEGMVQENAWFIGEDPWKK